MLENKTIRDFLQPKVGLSQAQKRTVLQNIIEKAPLDQAPENKKALGPWEAAQVGVMEQPQDVDMGEMDFGGGPGMLPTTPMLPVEKTSTKPVGGTLQEGSGTWSQLPEGIRGAWESMFNTLPVKDKQRFRSSESYFQMMYMLDENEPKEMKKYRLESKLIKTIKKHLTPDFFRPMGE